MEKLAVMFLGAVSPSMRMGLWLLLVQTGMMAMGCLIQAIPECMNYQLDRRQGSKRHHLYFEGLQAMLCTFSEWSWSLVVCD
ncbi:unnamed protein product [Chrysoparadoxa australica]